MRNLLTLIFALFCVQAVQAQILKKTFKFATFYGAVNGGNSLADVNTYTLLPNGSLNYGTIETPFDYSLALGVRKLARLGYENKERPFYNGAENSFADAATIGRVKGLEFLFEADYKRQQGRNFVDQQHFLRYVAEDWIAKAEYVQDGFADIRYFEATERYRYNVGEKLSFNAGVAQRFSEPYGFNPLNGLVGADFTNIAINRGYTTNWEGEWYTPEGETIAENSEIWRAVVVPQILNEYVEEKRALLPNQWNHSLVIGYDFYHYTKDFWLHSWGNVLPIHLTSNSEYSYNNFVDGNQWIDYGGGLILGYKLNKNIGLFLEGKYNKYWNRNWHNFSVGFNYIII